MTFPEVLAHKAVAMTNGRVVACGGEDTGYTDRCYDYTPSDGWTQIGSYPKIMLVNGGYVISHFEPFIKSQEMDDIDCH